MTTETTQLKMIWFALTMSIVLYAVIAYVIVPMGAEPFDAAFSKPAILVLHLAGLGMFVMSFVVPSTMLNRSNNVRGAMIMRWAMIESAAVCGLLAAFIDQDVRLFLPLGALALGGMLLAFPRE
jgi:hypothetical protein